jgi:transposase
MASWPSGYSCTRTLARTILRPRDIVILDNLGSHKGKEARRLVRAVSAHLIFLPPYSPDLSPIDQVFSKLRHLLRKASNRTVKATWRCAGELLKQFSLAECSNYLTEAGYVAT